MTLDLNLTQLPVARASDWRAEFGSFLRCTPNQKNRERSVLTLDAYEGDVELMAAWFTDRYDVEFAPDQLNQVNLKEYFDQLNCAPATYNRKLASVRMLIKWAMLNHVLDVDPTLWIPFADATRKSPRDLNDEERCQLEAKAEAGEESMLGLRDSVLFHLMGDAGLRIHETITLKLSDLHLDDGFIHVFGKGSKHRDVKIGKRLIQKLRLWLDLRPDSGQATLITDEHGSAICRQQAWKRFRLIVDQTDVRATPHVMRHTYVIRYMDAYMKGDPWKLPAAIDAVCQQTGDRPEVILAYYTRARESDMRAAAELM